MRVARGLSTVRFRRLLPIKPATLTAVSGSSFTSSLSSSRSDGPCGARRLSRLRTFCTGTGAAPPCPSAAGVLSLSEPQRSRLGSGCAPYAVERHAASIATLPGRSTRRRSCLAFANTARASEEVDIEHCGLGNRRWSKCWNVVTFTRGKGSVPAAGDGKRATTGLPRRRGLCFRFRPAAVSSGFCAAAPATGGFFSYQTFS